MKELNGVKYISFLKDTWNEGDLEDAMEMFVIHPYYTGRDKGAVMVSNPEYPGEGQASHLGICLFDTEEDAWNYIFTVVQPNDERAKRNYYVETYREYRK